MPYHDDYDLPRPHLAGGVSPVWRVLGILGMIVSAVLLVVSLALGAAFGIEHMRAQNAAHGGNPNWLRRPPGGPAAGEGDEDKGNAPYPLVADLRPQGALPTGEAPAARQPAPRDRFLALADDLWTVPQNNYTQELHVSPDGRQAAYVQAQMLMVGPVAGTAEMVGGNPAAAPGLLPFQRPRRPAASEQAVGVVGLPAWSPNSGQVYFADTAGSLRRYDVAAHRLEALPFHGDAPVPLGTDRLVFRRRRAAPKLDLPDAPAGPDPSEVVIGELTTGNVRVVVPSSGVAWLPLAVSADGKRLALASEPEAPPNGLRTQRLFVLELDESGAAPKPASPTCPLLSAAGWADDGNVVVYAHGWQAPPPDHWQTPEPQARSGPDLFLADPARAQATRLSRGGGFLSPSLDADGNLYFLASRGRAPQATMHLYRMSLAAARKFASQEPDPPAPDADSWARLFDRALKDAGVPADATGGQLRPETLARLADAFTAGYRQHFHTEPPADAEQWQWFQQSLLAQRLPRSSRQRLALVLGAAAGDYLRRKDGAVWRLSDGPLLPLDRPGEKPAESPFALAVSPFAGARSQFWQPERFTSEDEEERGDPGFWMTGALQRADGRPLVLTNDPSKAEVIADRADPDLARGVELYKKGQLDEADRVLLEIVGRQQHTGNEYLALHIGRLLYERQRFAALQRLMQPRVDKPAPSAAKYNLLGLAFLDTDPQQAAQEFKNALRCNLHYGPGYLNLAEAYAKAGDQHAAERTLQRLLRMLPFGPYADDARQRLAALQPERG